MRPQSRPWPAGGVLLLMVLLLMRVWLVALMWRPTVRRSLVGLQTHAAQLCLHIASIFMCTHIMLQSRPW